MVVVVMVLAVVEIKGEVRLQHTWVFWVRRRGVVAAAAGNFHCVAISNRESATEATGVNSTTRRRRRVKAAEAAKGVVVVVVVVVVGARGAVIEEVEVAPKESDWRERDSSFKQRPRQGHFFLFLLHKWFERG